MNFSTQSRAYVVAELGVNHNGDFETAKKLVRAAKDAGADAVKFQTFTAATLATRDTPKVDYQLRSSSSSETHFDMLERLELGRDEHARLFAYCAELKIDFLSTPYDLESARFLNELGVSMFKTASADIVDLPLQEYIASTGKPSIVATGMSTMSEIKRVVAIYDLAGNKNLVLLQCVSAYPSSEASLNLRAMVTLASEFGKPVGFSDHSEGHLAAALAVALGAKVIEKHFTLDKSAPGPDHAASSTPAEFLELVLAIRRAETMLGSARKEPQPEEKGMAAVSRKSLVAARTIRSGEVIGRDDLTLMRPGTGLGADQIPGIVGKTANKDLAAFSPITLADLGDS